MSPSPPIVPRPTSSSGPSQASSRLDRTCTRQGKGSLSSEWRTEARACLTFLPSAWPSRSRTPTAPTVSIRRASGVSVPEVHAQNRRDPMRGYLFLQSSVFHVEYISQRQLPVLRSHRRRWGWRVSGGLEHGRLIPEPIAANGTRRVVIDLPCG